MITPALNMRLSDYFNLAEMVKSQTATKHGIYNLPRQEDALENMRALCRQVLDPVRKAIARPVIITSGFRCAELNKRIGGAMNSQHMFGEAADFVVRGVDTLDVALSIASRDDIPFDQLIYEMSWSHKRSAWNFWIHISHRRVGENRGERLTIIRGQDGFTATQPGINALDYMLTC